MLSDRDIDPKHPPMSRAAHSIWRLIEVSTGAALLTFAFYLTSVAELSRNEKIGWSILLGLAGAAVAPNLRFLLQPYSRYLENYRARQEEVHLRGAAMFSAHKDPGSPSAKDASHEPPQGSTTAASRDPNG